MTLEPIELKTYKVIIRDIITEINDLMVVLEKENHDRIIFWDIIHPIIRNLCKGKYEDEYYADAVESAMKEVNKKVKAIYIKKTKQEKDGRDLMFSTFSPNNPIITIDDLSTQSGQNLQEGYMYIFGGAIQALRNPKAHDNLIISSNITIHQITLASMLMYILDNTKL